MTRSAGSFFRGVEFSRLVILAAMLAIGWPLVLYYGFASKPSARPVPPPIASQPVLPPPDTSEVFAAVQDVTPRSMRDEAAIQHLLDRTRETKPETLSASARREVTPLDLLKNPKKYRGLPIHLDGFASSVFAHDDPNAKPSAPRRLYEVWIRPTDHDQALYPVCAILEDVPASLPGGQGLDEPVVFNGYFLKLLRYQARDKERFAPMLVGRLAHYPAPTPLFNAPRSRFWTFLPLGLVFVYVALRVVFTMRKNRASLQARRSSLPPSDRIDPEKLDRWLAQPDTDAESAGTGTP